MQGQTDPSSQPLDGSYVYFVGDYKTEHPARDPNYNVTRYIQNMTDKGGLLGFTFTNLDIELSGNNLPEYLSVDVKRILGAFDGELTVTTGVTDAPYDHSKHVEKNVAKLVANDGLQWISASDGNLLIVDEDSGNDYGERRMAIKIDNSMNVTNSYLLSIAGGSKNPFNNQMNEVLPNAFKGPIYSGPTSSEHSGTWDVTALCDLSNSKDDLMGTGEVDYNMTKTLADKIIIGVIQDRNNSNGQALKNNSDAGGQIMMFDLKLP